MLTFEATIEIMSGTDKFLITGFSGFVSRHFLEYLENNGIAAEILGVDISDIPFSTASYKHVRCSFRHVDLLNKANVEEIISSFKPDYVLHLASYSSVAMSWKKPVESFANNTNIFLNLIESIRIAGIKCRVLSIGSSEEYGNMENGADHLREDDSLHPISPYAVARVSQEMLSKVYTDSYGMDIIMTRSFNHIGAYQKDIFVIPSFARQLIAMKNDPSLKKELSTGDTSIVRDFVDVRAVVEAYYLLFKKGKKGEVYNICNGTGTSLNEVIGMMASILDISVSRRIDPALVRPNDNKVIIGSNSKIKRDTGWENRYSLEQSLKDIISYYQAN
ncbi:MAG: GDP-mannose 4,6-dehydratase [Bacteroidia bacterium]